MGVIQGSINNLLATVATAARLGPNFERNMELKNLERQEKLLEKKAAPGVEMTGGSEYAREKEAIAERRAELKPTEKNAQAYYEAYADREEAELQEKQMRAKWESQQKDIKLNSYEKEIQKRMEADRKRELDLYIKQNELRGGAFRNGQK